MSADTPTCPLDAPYPRHTQPALIALPDPDDPAVIWRALARGLCADRQRPKMLVGRYAHGAVQFDRSALVTPQLPQRPVALRIYDDAGQARTLALDFDPGRVHGSTALVTEHTQQAAQLLAYAGAQVIEDVSERGGRHLLVPLAAPAARDELLPIVDALAKLFPSLDTSPLRNLPRGCITPPAALSKHGGRRRLVTALTAAIWAITARSHPQLLDRLRAKLKPASPPPPPAPCLTRTTATQPGRPRRLDPLHTAIAEHGIWPANRRTAAGAPWTGSEARFAVLCSAAARGWTLADVQAQIQAGHWPGLANLFARYAGRAASQLSADWARAMAYAARLPATKPVSQGHTSGKPTTPGGGQPNDPYPFLRRMALTAELAADVEPWGEGETGRTRRAVLRALSAHGMQTGSRVIEVGVRSLTLHTGLLDHSTVARVLRELREDPDGWVDLVRRGRGDHPDTYELRIPQRYQHLSAGQPLPTGRLPSVHAIFGVLGLAAWRVLEAVESGAGTFAAVMTRSGVSRAQTYRALASLTALRLVNRAANGAWRRARRSLHRAAGHLCVPQIVAARLARYRTERAQWRDWLAARGRLDWKALTAMASPDGPIWWPDINQLEPPPDHPDPPTPQEALALLTTRLGAEVLTDLHVQAGH